MSAATPDSISPFSVKQIVRCGVTFEVTTITPRCIVLKSLKTGKKATFASFTALNKWLVKWEWFVSHKRAMADKAA